MKLGFDFGSQNVHFVALSDDRIVRQKSIPHNGSVFDAAKGLIEATIQEFGLEAIERYGVTGNLSLHGIKGIDPILASIEANKFLQTGCHNILSIGCESFYLILLNDQFGYLEHSVNTDCASGTGSFIDQQAKRLEYSISEFAQEANHFAGKSATIATRCAVFAKSDIIHAQAEGFAKGAIAAGICEGVVRSIGANVIKGRMLVGGVVLIGGVSLNQKIASEFSQILGQAVTVPPEGVVFNAIGAALLGEETELGKLREGGGLRAERETREKLTIRLTEYPDFAADRNYERDGIEVTLYNALAANTFDTFLGICF